MATIPVSAAERVIRHSGGTRVSREAAEALATILEARGSQIAVKAIRFAQHAGRKTITAEDVRLASTD